MTDFQSQKTMDVTEVIQKRRSIRQFRDDPVPASIIIKLLEAARLAPSGSNLQPWRFMVITDSKQITDIGQMALNQKVFQSAPAIIVCCGDLRSYADNNRNAHREELSMLGIYDEIGVPPETIRGTQVNESSIQDNIPSLFLNVAIATEHIVLRATSLGLGTLWVGAFDRIALSKYICLPEGLIVVALMPIGYAAQDPSPRPRLSLEEITLPAPALPFNPIVNKHG